MNMLQNAPDVKIAIAAVSRDCFPMELARRRLDCLAAACDRRSLNTVALKTIIESERDALKAIDEADKAGCNTAVIYLGNFGPEGPLSIFAERFGGSVMVCAAAEETGDNLIDGRGDAMCGMLNASINFSLRSVPVYIPQYPVGLPDQLAERIEHFVDIARIQLGVAGLKIFAFGPRPQDFFACNAPIGQLYDMGVEVMENSELDMLRIYKAVNPNDPEVDEVANHMAEELGGGNSYPGMLKNLARFEVGLKRFASDNLGSRQYAVFANKCWPAFEPAFGFVPCYVNSRLSTQGTPVACEVDIYGALSQYICYLASGKPASLLDINNSVPEDMISGDLKSAKPKDLFMGFHCGNTPSCHMKNCSMKFQLIMNRLMEDPAKEPDITRGTLEGQIKPGPVSLFRIQGTADGGLSSYIADGNILDINPRSFGGIGVFAIPNFARFYRHVLISKTFPHHGAVAFSNCGKILYDATKMIGLIDINTPLPENVMYEGENPFELK